MCTIAALWCLNTVVWATNGLSVCEIIFNLFYQTVTKLQTFWIPNKFNASRKYKPSVLQSVHFIYNCRRAWMQHASWRTKISAVAAMGRPYRLYLKASVRLPVAERYQFPKVIAVPYTIWWRCYTGR